MLSLYANFGDRKHSDFWSIESDYESGTSAHLNCMATSVSNVNSQKISI